MPTMMSRSGILIVSAFLLVFATLLGCGSTADSSVATSESTDVVKGQIAACLERGGASFADSPSDLTFLKEAEAEESVSKPGFFYEKKTKRLVEVWTAARFEQRPLDWTIWFGQPFSADLTPLEIVEDAPSESFVMFVNRPSQRVRARTNTCLRFGDPEGHINFHPIHPG